MTKITIEYNLPEEQNEYDIHYHANKLYSALFEITTLMRNIEKGYINEAEKIYNAEFFEKLSEIILESGYWNLN